MKTVNPSSIDHGLETSAPQANLRLRRHTLARQTRRVAQSPVIPIYDFSVKIFGGGGPKEIMKGRRRASATNVAEAWKLNPNTAD